MTPALEIVSLTKRFGDKTAVDGIDFAVQPGEFFGFLGPNGAGKTTTINCTVGITRPSAGSIRVFGHDVDKDYRAARAKIGLAPQDFNIDPFIGAATLLDYVGGFYGVPAADRKERITRLLLDFEMMPFKDQPFRTLSGGQKRRVTLARALIHEPDLIILDEPTAGVDVELRHDLWRWLKELNGKGKTIVLTSHYLEEVQALCTRIAIINKGKLAFFGPKEELVHDGRTLEQSYLAITGREPIHT